MTTKTASSWVTNLPSGYVATPVESLTVGDRLFVPLGATVREVRQLGEGNRFTGEWFVSYGRDEWNIFKPGFLLGVKR